MSDPADKRCEPRIPFRAYATLITTENQYAAHLLNISRNGALIAVIQDHEIKTTDEISLRIETEAYEFSLNGWVAHVRDHYMGIKGRPSTEDQREQLDTFIAQIEQAPMQKMQG